MAWLALVYDLEDFKEILMKALVTILMILPLSAIAAEYSETLTCRELQWKEIRAATKESAVREAIKVLKVNRIAVLPPRTDVNQVHLPYFEFDTDDGHSTLNIEYLDNPDAFLTVTGCMVTSAAAISSAIREQYNDGNDHVRPPMLVVDSLKTPSQP